MYYCQGTLIFISFLGSSPYHLGGLQKFFAYTQFPSSHWLYWTFTSITPRILSGEVPPARSQCVASQWLGSSYVMTWGCTSVTVGLQQFMLKFYIAVHCRMINMIWYDIYIYIMVICLYIVKITYYIEYLDIPSTFFFIFDTWVWINTY